MKFIQIPSFVVALGIVGTGIIFSELMTRSVGSPWRNKPPIQREIGK